MTPTLYIFLWLAPFLIAWAYISTPWLVGRQNATNGPYHKRVLAMRSRWDVYVLRYPPHLEIPFHRDTVKGFRHYRLNIRLIGAAWFYWENVFGMVKFTEKRVNLFRPDQVLHSVTNQGKWTYTLSIGWIVKES